MASFPCTWLADVLRAEGCTVVEEGDWRHHGRDGSFSPKAVMLHHDASPAGETSNGADVIINGRPDLAGPLAQLWLDYDGRWHVISAGRANHAGTGGPWGVISTDDGNADSIGIETDHTTNEKWSDAQRSEALKGVGAILRKLGVTSRDEIDRALCAHKEYTSRKPDPDPLDMDYAREQVAAYLAGHGGGDAPVKLVQKTTGTDKVLVSSEWKILQFTDNEDLDGGMFCIGKGPTKWFEATVELYAQGPVGALFHVYCYREEGDVDKATYMTRTFEVPAGGIARVELHQSGTMNDSGERLRVRAKAQSSNVTITQAASRAAMW